MKKLLVAAVAAFPVLASAQNLLLNNAGFEGLAGTTIPGWTSSNLGSNPAAVIVYGPGAAFGEAVMADPLTVGSPELGGRQGLYFVEDTVTQTVSQNFTTSTAFNYNWGFDRWVPLNGLANGSGVLTTSILLGNAVVASNVFNIAGPAQSWVNFSGVFLGAAQTTYTFRFSFAGVGFPSEDIVVDRAFVTLVPEPGTYGLMAAGLLVVGFVARRRSSKR